MRGGAQMAETYVECDNCYHGKDVDSRGEFFDCEKCGGTGKVKGN